MKTVLFVLMTLFAANSFGQTRSGILTDTVHLTKSDTALRIIYADKIKPQRPPAFVVNGKFAVNGSLFSSLDPKRIDKIDVLKRDTLIDNTAYDGIVYVQTKSDYAPKIVSLTDLKNKYTDFKEKPVVFMLDGEIINSNYDNYMVDEGNLLTIIIDKLQTEKEKIDLGLVKLLTKSAENIKKRNQIRIRGAAVAMN